MSVHGGRTELCEHCGASFPVCACGVEGCNRDAHLYRDCPSEYAAAYRDKRAVAEKRRDVLAYLRQEEQRKREDFYGLLFESLDR